MSIIKKLFGKKKEVLATKDELISMNVCPNCWGKKEYQKEFEIASRERMKLLNDKEQSEPKAFIQQFVETHITGIMLINDGHKRACLSCNTTFK